MMGTSRGPRWTEPNSEATPWLRELIQREQNDAPSDAELRALASKIAGSVAAPAEATQIAGGPRATPKRGWRPASNSALWTTGLTVVAAALALWARGGQPAAREPAPLAGAEVRPTPAAASRPLPLEASTVAGPEPALEQEHAVSVPRQPERAPVARIRRRSAGVLPEPARSAEVAAEDELELLRRARASLAAAPERALDLAAQHRRDHLEGAFAEEREAIAIEALVKLGMAPEARRRARDFARLFPRSAYQRRLTAVLDGI